MKTDRVALAAVAVVVMAVPVLAADLTVVYKTTGSHGTGTATTYWSAERMRMGDGETDTIIEFGPGRMVSVNHKKEYTEITFAEMEAAAARMQQKSAQAEQQMAGLPPAVRERMAQMMGGVAASVKVTKGAVRKVAGYDCQDYNVSAGTMVSIDICATTAVAPPAANIDYRKYASFAGMANNPMFKGMTQAFDEVKKIQGFALAETTSVTMMGRSTVTSREAVEVKKGSVPAATFDLASIAPGYKKVPHPMTTMK